MKSRREPRWLRARLWLCSIGFIAEIMADSRAIFQKPDLSSLGSFNLPIWPRYQAGSDWAPTPGAPTRRRLLPASSAKAMPRQSCDPRRDEILRTTLVVDCRRGPKTGLDACPPCD